MIRFMADTWVEVLLRPLVMAAPNGWAYVEAMAPDFRFVLALALALVALATIIARKNENVRWKPAFLLLGLIFVSFVPWMATTGNGRYFMPYLILIGPLCIGLIRIFPTTRIMTAAVAFLVVGLQGFALYQNNPWKPIDLWEWVSWNDAPYFSIDIDPLALDPFATYISVSNQSLSLVAPQFPASSHWVNLSVFTGDDVSKKSTAYEPVRKILETSSSLKLFQRSAPRQMVVGTDQPNQNAISAINAYLQPHRLAIKEPTDCQLLRSKSLISNTLIGTDENEVQRSQIQSQVGFWICSLKYPVTLAPIANITLAELKARQVFEKMESLCPRFFPSGQKLVGSHPAGYARVYASSDSSLIVSKDDNVYFTYARALNPQKIGPVNEILKPEFVLDCNNFQGRKGLPWEREI